MNTSSAAHISVIFVLIVTVFAIDAAAMVICIVAAVKEKESKRNNTFFCKQRESRYKNTHRALGGYLYLYVYRKIQPAVSIRAVFAQAVLVEKLMLHFFGGRGDSQCMVVHECD